MVSEIYIGAATLESGHLVNRGQQFWLLLQTYDSFGWQQVRGFFVSIDETHSGKAGFQPMGEFPHGHDFVKKVMKCEKMKI